MVKTKVKQRNYWIIDKDHHADPKAQAPCNANAVGVMGPRGCPKDDKALTLRFRMLVDQDEEEAKEESPVIYEGRMLPFDQMDEESTGFEPLDHFGMPNFGCAYIEYWQSGKGGGWKGL